MALDPAVRARLEQHQQDPRLFWWTREDGSRDEFHYCTVCGTGSLRWPCDSAQALAAYDAATQARVAVVAVLQTHARHRACCAEHLTSGRLGCDCGLTEALEAPDVQ